MAVENTNLQSDLYDGDGVTTTFNAQFTFILNTDVKVIVLEADGETETVLTLTTDYTVNFVGDSGEIVLVAPLASGKKIRIVSNIPPIQPYEFPLGNKFPADRVEAALDRVTLVSQRVLSELMRTVSLPATSLITNLELPDGGATRLGYVWRWNTVDGNTLEAVSPVEIVFGDSLSDYMKTFLANSDSASARGTLGLGTLATQSGTFSGDSSGTNTGDQVAFTTIAVASQSDIVADSTSDTLTLVAGSNVTITTNAASDTITIASTGGGSPGGSTTNVQYNNAGSFAGNANLTYNGAGVLTAKTAVVAGGNATASGYLQLNEDTDSGTNYIRIQAPSAVTTDTVLTLPNGAGSSSQFLQTNGSGTLTWATPSGSTAATQTDQETATSTTTFVCPGRQQYHPSSCKAWAKINEVTTTTILASYNVTSITDHGVGDTTITFTTAFSSANYGVSLGGVSATAGGRDGYCYVNFGGQAAGSVRVITGVVNAYFTLDLPAIFISCFGDQ